MHSMMHTHLTIYLSTTYEQNQELSTTCIIALRIMKLQAFTINAIIKLLVFYKPP